MYNEIKRRKTSQVRIGSLFCGSDYPVSIQSMTKTDTRDITSTVNQINKLAKIGCELIRVAVLDLRAAKAIKDIKREIAIPLEADIHFSPILAIEAIKGGSDCIRLNPGNIKDGHSLKEILKFAVKKGISIRVGINSGSMPEGDSTKPHKEDPALAMVNTALNYIKIFEKQKFYELIVSLKASDVLTTIRAYRTMSKRCGYPFHLGVTATGFTPSSIIKSSIGIGTLLLEGIGDTIRVSLTDTPEQEVIVAREILSSLRIRRFSHEVISCPTCGRCQIDINRITKKVKEVLDKIPLNGKKPPIKVAIMGCIVNGPGEAKDADIGIAGGNRFGALFKKGMLIKKVKETELIDTLIKEIKDEVV
ncbi:MAG: flavodoxin-dependent (E)-4-hydroxy-3-methylbut-2-enyl-diphosphate synthase [Candidatus Omnitrophica bacterium]|nr:flavodoxin-dependent (E)-4-hydroxy-3-methylbut-2-enyl-diphosphate synthase [Candidatus Omnitrophota bacterium]